MSRVVSLRWLASRTDPITERQIEQIDQWLKADWESHDIHPDAVRLIRRLTDELRARAVETRVLQNILRSR